MIPSIIIIIIMCRLLFRLSGFRTSPVTWCRTVSSLCNIPPRCRDYSKQACSAASWGGQKPAHRTSISVRGNALSTSGKIQLACQRLTSRSLVKVQGRDATSFLQGLVTNDMTQFETVTGLAAISAMLLSPQVPD